MTKLLLNTLLHYFQEKTWRLAASVTFYVLFAVVPLILFATALAGLPFDQEEARTAILRQLDDIVGEQGSAAIKEMLQNYKKPTQGVVSAILGLMALMFGSVNALAQLRDAMNSIWKVKMDVFIHSGHPAGSSLCLCLRIQKGRFLIQNSESSIQILKPGTSSYQAYYQRQYKQHQEHVFIRAYSWTKSFMLWLFCNSSFFVSARLCLLSWKDFLKMMSQCKALNPVNFIETRPVLKAPKINRKSI